MEEKSDIENPKTKEFQFYHPKTKEFQF